MFNIPDNPIKSESAHWHIDFGYLLQPIECVDAIDPEETKWFDYLTDRQNIIEYIKGIQNLNRK